MDESILSQALPFVHPGLAAAALAAGLIPVLIHLINRRRYRRVPWAAMSFLLAANRRSARRMRLEQLALMLVRVGAVVLLGMAIARPYVSAAPLAALHSSRVHRVLLIDNSLSMSARREDGQTRFRAALAAASRLLASFPPTDAVSIVTLAEPAEALIAQASFDRRFVREQLAAIRPTQRATDTAAGVALALEILRESTAAPGNRAVYVLSDFPVRAWKSESPASPTAAVSAVRRLAETLSDSAADLALVPIRPGPGANIAVTRLGLESPLVGVNLPVRVAAQVTNFSDSAARMLSLQLRRDGQTIRRQQLPPLAPGETTVAFASTDFAAPGTHLVEARVSASTADALDVDDIRYLSVEVRESAPVLLVDGRPGAKLLEGQAGFLATALAPKASIAGETGGRGGRQTRTAIVEAKIVSEPELGAEALAAYDVVALCNVARLSREQWTQLERFVVAGGGLFIALGELVSIDHYNRYGYADGAGLLPGRLGRVVDAAPGGARTGFTLDERPNPLLADFAGHPNSGLFLARVDRYLPLEPDARRAEVVLRYTSGDPALVTAAFGKGRVMVWTTTVNMEWTNLPAKGDYVTVMLDAVASLVPRRGELRNILVGQTLREPLTPAQSSMPLRVTLHEGSPAEPGIVPAEGGLALEFGPVESAQPVTVSIAGESRLFAVNTDPTESDLHGLDAAALEKAVDRPVRILEEDGAGQAVAPAKAGELSPAALYAVLLLLLTETWLAVRFGAPHGASTPGHHNA